MGNNQVVIDHLEVYSNQINQIAHDAEAAVKESIESFSGMGDGWEGNSYQAFSKSYNSLQTHLNQIPKAMAEVSKAVSTISNNYQTADNEETK